MIRSYSEMLKLETFEERFNYLKLDGSVGTMTFGSERYLNQVLYNSPEWKKIRRDVILRDNGCDLGVEGFELSKHQKILIHHINPITIEDIKSRNPIIFDMDNLITVSHNTHNAIHYGDENNLITNPVTRTKNDTCPWRN